MLEVRLIGPRYNRFGAERDHYENVETGEVYVDTAYNRKKPRLCTITRAGEPDIPLRDGSFRVI